MKHNKFNFTKSLLDAIALPERGKRLRLYDSKTRGLLLDITSTGQKSFWMRRTIAGRNEWKRLGAYPDLSIEIARGHAAVINGEVAAGKSLAQAGNDDEPTLEQAFEMYMTRHATKNTKTWKAMQREFELRLSKFKMWKLSHVTPDIVEHLHLTLGETRGHYAANRAIQLLRAIYNKAIKWRIYEGKNPCYSVTMYKERPRRRFLSKDEVRRLLLALQEETNIHLRDFVWFLMLTGVRKSNLLAMKWCEVSFEDRTWIIPETKNGDPQIIALSDYELDLLRNRLNDTEYVFPGTAGFLKDPKRSWHSLLKRAQIEDCTFHDLRRNLAAWMASKNINVSLIKGALNHKDLKTTLLVYAHTVKEAELEGRMIAHQAMFEAAGIDCSVRLTRV